MDRRYVPALSGQLSWTHFRRIIYLDDPHKRDFYADMCRIEKWNTRTLHRKIQSMLYERTALSKKPDKLIAMELKKLREEDKLTPDRVFRDRHPCGILLDQDPSQRPAPQKTLPSRSHRPRQPGGTKTGSERTRNELRPHQTTQERPHPASGSAQPPEMPPVNFDK